MKKTAIDNLDTIIKTGYKYICLSHDDFAQFLNIPWQQQLWYPTKDWMAHGKQGWFQTKKGMVMVWSSYIQEKDHIKISEDRLPTDSDSNKIWSDPSHFGDIDGAERVARILKLKAFW